MLLHRRDLPTTDAPDLFLTYVGMETDLIFTQGIDLPGFASFPLLATPDGRDKIAGYAADLIAVCKAHDVGVILETPTWVANHDRAAPLGYASDDLQSINQDAVNLMAEVRARSGYPHCIISANIGPRDDAYAPGQQMTVQDAENYHSAQIDALSQTPVDVISGYTLADVAEAIGIVRAAQKHGLPVVMSFTVETDGRLPTGPSLAEAIETVDAETDGYCTYFMINCAHPEHFSAVLDGADWTKRLGGIVANASKCSHAELDNATELDAGDPHELAQELSEIRKAFPQVAVLGGCCGTDMRHIMEIAKTATAR